ncbi:MAG: ABC transporter permease [Saccharospirillum sp.]
MPEFYLAWRYLNFHRRQTAVLVLVLAVIMAVPALLNTTLQATDARLTERADGTPLLIGARGSRLDLAMSSLYFSDDRPEPVSMAASEAIWDSGLAMAIPLYNRFRVQDDPVIGTTLDYFSFRDLTLAEGRSLTVLGDAVVGAQVAQRRNLQPGDTLITSPDNLFDLAGAYPLRLTVSGILNPANSADDDAIFVDVKTAWVIEGIGHGHDDALMNEDGEVNASIEQFREITEANRDTFHFHGDPNSYPITGVIAVPYDQRALTLLRGRYLDTQQAEQAVVPATVIGALLDQLIAIKRLVDAVVLVILVATLISVSLAIALTLKLRQRELYTLFKLGARRSLTARLVFAESLIVLVFSAALAVILTLTLNPLATAAATRLLVGNG